MADERKYKGVLTESSETREENLNRNKGNYAMYEDTTTPTIGDAVDPYEREEYKPFEIGEQGLQGYTFNQTNDLGRFITSQYDINPEDKYEVKEADKELLKNWRGKYENYGDYIAEIYGGEPKKSLGEYFSETHTFWEVMGDALTSSGAYLKDVNAFVNYNNLSVIMREDAPAVAHYPYPYRSLDGEMITNVNSANNKETAMGAFSNYQYAALLKNAAYFNTYRSNNLPYITEVDGDNISKSVGMNTTNIFDISSRYQVDTGTGRINETFEFGTGFGDLHQSWNPGMTQLEITRSGSKMGQKVFDALAKNLLAKPNTIYGGDSSTLNISLYDVNKTPVGNREIGWNESESGEYVGVGRLNGIDTTSPNDLLSRTAKLFKEQKINTIIGRFSKEKGNDENDMTSMYGMSHGRNLLSSEWGKSTTTHNGYTNPYCRVWTNYHGYTLVNRMIRHGDDGDDLKSWKKQEGLSRVDGGMERLIENSVLNWNNGFVNITPSKSGKVDIKKTMFSLENLAWKDANRTKVLSPEQIGPMGGRIMWFPPYDIKFNEQVSVNWNQQSFIGRGEQVYTYTNTDRSGTLSFKLLIDHPSILDYWRGGRQDLTSYDDSYSQATDEYKVLRFFAGCENLEPLDKDTTEIKITPRVKTIEPVFHPAEKKKIRFAVYFPNNYSGIDDAYSSSKGKNPKMNSAVNPFLYIFAGIDAQEGSDLMKFNQITPDSMGYEIGIRGISMGVEKKNGIKGKYGTYYYRVDNDCVDEKLREYNYSDYLSFQMNLDASTNYGYISGNNVYSFAEMFSAAYNDVPAVKTYAQSIGVKQEKVDELVTFFKNKKNLIKTITVTGHASPAGYKTKNQVLASNRAATTKAWMIDAFGLKESVFVMGDSGEIDEPVDIDNSSASMKRDRCVIVDINYEEEGYYEDFFGDLDYEVEDIVETITTHEGIKGEGRYDSESEFFEILSKNDSFLRSTTVKKIKYFDPAFHSITPEGFNNRLTFLHQCTRQGNTVGNGENTKDGLNTQAGNLAFGRAPVCVLRIGDFFYTRIIIDSMTINYEPLSWDINPEGVGVQPMLADISLNFKFLGGSDITGPIARLQNALSFNYYANTSVYDNRSDQVTYGEAGKVKNYKLGMESIDN